MSDTLQPNKSQAFTAGLSDADVEAIGRRLDDIQQRVKSDLGAKDRRYILRVILAQRWLTLAGRAVIFLSLALLPQWQHALAGWSFFWPVIAAGTLALTLGKILENMEIGHNVMHGQWDWMNDPQINSHEWEWDHPCPTSHWKHSHNFEHHSYTNVLDLDRDIGYGMLRATKHQPWHPIYLLQPLNMLLMAVFFSGFIALHDLRVADTLTTGKEKALFRRKLREMLSKAGRQSLKDYLLWPLLAGPFFLIVLAANITASVLRNIWKCAVIFCGHFSTGVEHFSTEQVENETRGGWYLRQMLGSCNIRGGKLLHIFTGNLSHQIEHHLFPDLPSNRYAEVAPQVQQLCEDHGLQYNSRRFGRQLGGTLWGLAKLSLPNRSQSDKPGSYRVSIT